MTLRSRFALSLLTIAVVLLVPLALALWAVQDVEDELRGMGTKELSASLAVGLLRDGLNELRTADTRMFALRDAPSIASMERSAQQVESQIDSLARFRLEQTAPAVDSLRVALALIRRNAGLARAGQWEVADSISQNVVSNTLDRVFNSLNAAETSIRLSTHERVELTRGMISTLQYFSAFALVIALLLAAVVAVRLTRAVQQPVAELERGMAAVADGDFSQQLTLDPTRTDEFGRLASSFESMTRQLTELDKLKAEFVSIASHELKTPLNVIIGYLELLSESVYGPITDKQREVIHVVQAQSHNVARLARQLLDVSRFEAGGGKLEPRAVPLARLLEDLEKAFHVLAVQKGVRFVVTQGDRLPTDVVWDPDRVNEVLGNLLSNAFKFTERGGVVELRAERTGEDIHLEVRDTGAGIPAEQVPRVFDKFYQADNQRHSSRSGTGLGLAIAKGIVEAHGGTITVESTRGVGTTFQITMPVTVSARRAPTRDTPTVMEAV